MAEQRAAQEGDLGRLQELVADRRARLEQVDSRKRTLLHYASIKGQTHVVEWLLHAGANVNARDRDGWTALLCAAMKGHTDCVRVLLGAGADASITTKWRDSALHYSARRGHTELLRFAGERWFQN